MDVCGAVESFPNIFVQFVAAVNFLLVISVGFNLINTIWHWTEWIDALLFASISHASISFPLCHDSFGRLFFFVCLVFVLIFLSPLLGRCEQNKALIFFHFDFFFLRRMYSSNRQWSAVARLYFEKIFVRNDYQFNWCSPFFLFMCHRKSDECEAGRAFAHPFDAFFSLRISTLRVKNFS